MGPREQRWNENLEEFILRQKDMEHAQCIKA